MSDPTDPGATGSHDRPGRSARVGDSGSPVGSPLTIVLAVIAVAAGFLIFRSISDDGDAGGLGDLPGQTTAPTGATTPGQTTVEGDAGAGATTTAQAPTDTTRTGATVVVGNASASGGVAAPMSEQLAELGYTMGEPTSQIEGPENLETSIVYYVVGNNTEAVARTLALDMGGLEYEPMPAEVPVDSMGNGTVLLMLGNDYAGEEPPGPPPAAPAAPTNPTTTTPA